MKKIFIYLFASLFLSSCNYLDVVPDDSPTLADEFRNENTAENFVYSIYSFIPQVNHVRNDVDRATTNEMVGSNHWTKDYFNFIRFQQGDHNPSSVVNDIWANNYRGIRQAYIFLNNIESVKPLTISQEEYDAKKKVWIAEAKFLIAYFHFYLLEHYGPVVLIDKEIPTTASLEEMSLSRRPYDECVAFIAKLIDEAMVDLPRTVDVSNLGRATKVAAQSIKSKMYLTAASPLWNGNSEFYSNFKNKDGEQLVNLTFDKEKWKKAMDETQKAILMAEEVGSKLYEYTKTNITNPFDKAVMNTRWQMVDPWNSELLWGYSGKRESDDANSSFQYIAIPIGWRTGPPYGALAATLTAVELFYSKNGIPADKDPNYDWNNRYQMASGLPAGQETIKLHTEREPRFYAYIGYDRGKYEISSSTRTLLLRAGETNGMKSFTSDHFFSGYAIKKGVHPDTRVDATAFTQTNYPFPIVRLAELYLNYAEASANYSNSLDANGLKYVNAVRTRAGIPGIFEANGNLAGADLIKAIQRERMIELMFEGHWSRDLKRWKLAESYYATDRNGLKGLYSRGKTAQEFYKPTVLEKKELIFDKKHYLLPINQTYVNNNINLVQNPDW
ncbi:RagB/SusD family nutrient uptake outer membrane protein [Sphingobacterium kyonggiense]|uniref:RagB/SusD family nutrient uptake outer membrane protein n=1 Tax=Sphingobacterium kyonggiense TaxID=714075 RepID=A0ABP7YRP6_9SPHI